MHKRTTAKTAFTHSISRLKLNQIALLCCCIYSKRCRRAAATICFRPLQVDNIFVFIPQVAPVPACWLFKTSATS